MIKIETLKLFPLFGTTCLEEPLPEGDIASLTATIGDNPALAAMCELAPVAGHAPEPMVAPEGPRRENTYDYTPPTPGFGR